MQSLPKNATAILGGLTLALLSFAGTKTGVGQQQPRFNDASLRSSELRGHAALSRVPVTAFKVALVKNRRPANSLIAYTGIVTFSHRLRFAEAVSSSVRSTSGQSRRYTTSPRAPPIS
jgi:hypothetical protein